MNNTAKSISKIAQLVGDRIEELRGVKSQKDIAEIVGYENQNMVTMIKNGSAKVVLERVPLLAKALEVDEVRLFRLAMEQSYDPKTVETFYGLISSVSSNELRILEVIREASGDSDPALSSNVDSKLRDLFNRVS